MLVIDDVGSGQPVLLLHGGGGPETVAPFAGHLSARKRVLTPTLPGWNGTARPAGMDTIGDYAVAFLRRLTDDGLRDVVVIGSSIGGWIAAEMALRDDSGRVLRLVLVDAVGIEVEGEPVTDFYSLDPRGIVEHSFHDPDRFYVDPATIPAEQAERQRANIATMSEVAGDMVDPGLRGKLAGVRSPALVVWGDSDRIVTPAYGRAYADAFADARFELITDAGHLPQLEKPDATFAVIETFLRQTSASN